MLLYRKQTMNRDEFLYCVTHAQEQFHESIHFILGDLNINALVNPDNYIARYLTDYKLVNNEPTHISGSLIDHIYVHKSVHDTFDIKAVLHSVYYSDHDTVVVKFLKL